MRIESSQKFNPIEQSIETPNTKEKAEQFFGHCFQIDRLEEGDRIPVGGESIFSPEIDIKVTADFEQFQELFQQIHGLSAKYDLPKLKEYLTSQGIEIDEKLFSRLFAFTKKLEQQYPDNPERSDTRRKLYKEKGKEIKLSDIFKANTAECAEVAALAQGYLQQEGVGSSYFSGDVLWSRDGEFSEEHSFLLIRIGDKVYIYDPTNPTDTTAGKFPSIYTTEVNFEEEIRKGQKRFVTAKNIISKEEAFYGVNDGTNVLAENDII